MKLSDAIVLGSAIIRPAPGALGNHEMGCALGMGLAAFGENTLTKIPLTKIPLTKIRIGVTQNLLSEVDNRKEKLQRRWPWLLNDGPIPCHCWDHIQLPGAMNAMSAIAHIFDHHVYGERDWTFADLLAWIRKQEPEEENGTRPDVVELNGVENLAAPVSA